MGPIIHIASSSCPSYFCGKSCGDGVIFLVDGETRLLPPVRSELKYWQYSAQLCYTRTFEFLYFFWDLVEFQLNCRQYQTSTVYNEVLVLCFYITLVSVIMDIVHKIEDIQESMKNVRLISSMAVNVWLHLYLR